VSDELDGISRREALEILAAAAALPGVGPTRAVDAVDRPQAPRSAPVGPRGTPSDPDLIRPRIWWPKVLTASERATLTTVCDVILPADERSPGAGALGAAGFVDEWVSAPGDDNRAGLILVQGGLRWLDVESDRRFGRPFVRLTAAERSAICDDICHLPDARPEHRAGARFFSLVRDLTLTAFYTTREGMRDIGYVGNVPLARFDPPPADLLHRLGLEPEDG
jgi:hypothetical protein